MSKPARRPTLADVAAASGMSKSAVSMILNERPGSRLSPEAAARVREAAEALGYRPNPAAQSLRWGKTRTIGLVSDQVTVTRFASGISGNTSQPATLVPSEAAVSTRSRRPGNSGYSTGDGSTTVAPDAASIATTSPGCA